MRLFLLALFMPIYALAGSYDQGSMEVGGAVGITNTSTSGTQIQFSPRIQYFLIDNLALGLTIDYNKNDDAEELGIGPSATYYLNFSERFVPFISQTILYKNYSGELADGEDGLYATTAVGLNYPLGDKTALSLSYEKLYSIVGDQDAEESESLSWGFRAYF
tara:strand:+ start:307 stop:792 length:486 start_codon:yes stop_codon:yes gene_type:complete